MADDSELETLLVLCCLVAAVVFLCFSVGTVNLASQIAEAHTAKDDDPSRLASDIERLSREVEQLQREITTRREAARESSPEDLARRADRLRDVAAMAAEIERLRERITAAQAELARQRQRVTDAAAKASTTSEVRDLRRTLTDLEHQLEARRKAISAMSAAVDPAFEDNLGQLRKRRDELDREMRDLERQAASLREEPGTFSIRKNLTGSTTQGTQLAAQRISRKPSARGDTIATIGSAESALAKVLSTINRTDQRIAFFVHGNSFDMLRRAREIVAAAGVEVGWWPFDAESFIMTVGDSSSGVSVPSIRREK